MVIFPAVRKGMLPVLLAISYSCGAVSRVFGVEPTSLLAADPGREAQLASRLALLNVVLKHDQSKLLPDIINQAKKQGFYDKFPRKATRAGAETK